MPWQVAVSALLMFMIAYPRMGHADWVYESYKDSTDNGNYLTEADEKTLFDLQQSESPGPSGRGMGGMVSAAGEVTFSYGSSRPVIVCAVLELCDIALEGGEVINSVQIGDSARWHVSTAASGNEGGRVQHLIVKPLDNGLKTSMVVATDRRTYHLRLKSTFDDYMPLVKFVYPGQELSDMNRQLEDYRKKNSKKGGTGKPSGGVEASKLRFDYELEGDDEIMPVRVYHDGQKTYIDMKDNIYARKTPALLIVSKRGGWFSSDREHVANYRMQGNRYIIDGVLQEAKLILGEEGENYSVEIHLKGT